MRTFLMPSLFNNSLRVFDNDEGCCGAFNEDTNNTKLCDYRVNEEESSYNIEVDIPGVSDKDIDISIDENVISIKADRKKEVKDAEGNVTEEIVAHYERHFTLSDAVDKDSINAISKDGMLMLSLPKKVEEKIIKKIEVNKA